ncbi:MAG: hypothetical protein HN778_05815 [Prolixibacteraceae bacterium]|jgi:hypothetical protein|nr:hypothetical protein [Prolixibacteraceae bacterium]MBT6005532.1 hypothetical protein [Prolixibacteraceae bacterium]MBT6766907.1 hypothetical protein [Prolixibacteraceae bacterium]MBT6997642.1 hypothetical protein [Prolixibacteraceae bacterium]MBT7394332.1 hypothetical protein [Prolixibacteraceae bacterium]
MFSNISAQEVENVENIFKGTRLVNAQSANLAEQGEMLLLIQHRFGDISNGLYELFGLDQASMRIGFEYGFTKNINLGFGRSTFFKTYDAFGKIRLMQQNEIFPFTIVVVAEGSVPTLRNYFPSHTNKFSDKLSSSAQIHLAKIIGNFGFQLSPGYLNTGYLPFREEKFSTYTLGFGGSAKLSKKVSLNIEYLHNFNNVLSNTRPLSLGIDLDTGGHLFQLIISNSQRMFNQALLTETAGEWSKGNLFFGFNLIREFKLEYY